MDADLELVVARLLDFFGRRTPWHRRLWAPSLIHCIDEVAELSVIVRETGKGTESLLSYRRFLKTEIEADAGVSELQRDQLVRLLNSKPNLTPADVRQLQPTPLASLLEAPQPAVAVGSGPRR